MADKTHVKDNSSLHRYRTELPNLIDDMGLSVYAFRLYVHLKRVAGDGGACFEGARTLAEKCGISAGKIAEAKDELLAAGVIERTSKSVRGGQVDYITIVDLWPQNFREYSKESGQDAITSNESDHHAITSEKAITTRSLRHLSDHSETIKRSRGDRINNHEEEHDDDDDDRAHVKKRSQPKTIAPLVAYLSDQGMGAAPEFADLDPVAACADFDARRADGQSIPHIVKQWRQRPPTPGAIYGRQTTTNSAERPASHHGSDRSRARHGSAPADARAADTGAPIERGPIRDRLDY